MREEKTVSSKSIFKGVAVNLRVDTVQMPDGRESIREIIEHPECIVVIPVDKEDNVLLVKQYRKPVEKELLEVPAGGIDEGEDIETAVRREMQEETGYLPQKLVKLGGFYSAPGFCTEYLHLYLATDLTPSRLFAEDTEGIELVKIPVSGIKELLASGEVCDAKSFAGLYMYLAYRERNGKD